MPGCCLCSVDNPPHWQPTGNVVFSKDKRSVPARLHGMGKVILVPSNTKLTASLSLSFCLFCFVLIFLTDYSKRFVQNTVVLTNVRQFTSIQHQHHSFYSEETAGPTLKKCVYKCMTTV